MQAPVAATNWHLRSTAGGDAELLELNTGLDEELGKFRAIADWVPNPRTSSILYRTVYDICTYKLGPAGPARNRGDSLTYELFLNRVNDVINALLLQSALPVITSLSDDLEQVFSQVYTAYCPQAKFLCKVFHYLGRYYVDFNSLPSLKTTIELRFHQLVFCPHALPHAFAKWVVTHPQFVVDEDEDAWPPTDQPSHLLARQFALWRSTQDVVVLAQRHNRARTRWDVVYLLDKCSPLPNDVMRIVCDMMPESERQVEGPAPQPSEV